jgi:hypothetical protein
MEHLWSDSERTILKHSEEEPEHQKSHTDCPVIEDGGSAVTGQRLTSRGIARLSLLCALYGVARDTYPIRPSVRVLPSN